MDWFYTMAGTNERQGPRTFDRMKEKIRSGELGPNDKAWRVGMSQWTPVAQVPELAALLPGAMQRAMPVAQSEVGSGAVGVGTVAASAAHDLTYYAPRIDTPARVLENLRKYAPATGPTGDWPLSDGHLEQFSTAVKLRKRILGGANLARLMFALALIAFVIIGVSALVAFAGTTSAQRSAIPMLIFAGVFFPFVLLYWFCGQAIRYCRAWGSLVMAILVSIGLIVQLASMVMIVIAISAASSGRTSDTIPALLGGVFGILVGVAFAWVFWRAWAATGKYLATPVWCQEAIAISELAK